MRQSTAPLVALLLAGCVTPPQPYWYRADGDTATANADLYQCTVQTLRAVPDAAPVPKVQQPPTYTTTCMADPYGAPYGHGQYCQSHPMVNPYADAGQAIGQSLANAGVEQQRNNLITMCMKGHGYQLRER